MNASSRGAVCNVAVTVHGLGGHLLLFHSMWRQASDGGCTCPELRRRSCQAAHRHADGMGMHPELVGALITMLMCIRQIYQNARDREVKAVEGII